MPGLVLAQSSTSSDQQIQEVVITGTRIAQSDGQQPVSIIDRATIDRTGLSNIGELLQQLTTGGKALNTKFNSSGNFGYPPDGGGIGAGAAEVDLRNLDSKRVLVLVDGIRWVNESSGSGVSGSADLNTIPLAIVDHIEVLEDGASAIYGSDAIAGVVNIITRKKFQGVEINAYGGDYSKGGTTKDASLVLGGNGDRYSGVFVASFFDQQAISSGKWWQSASPQPYGGPGAGSSATPQGRATFCDHSRTLGDYGSCNPAQDFYYDVTLNNGVATPVWNAADPSAGTYHDWSGADRFNYAPYNYLLTPSQRKSLYTNIDFQLSDDTKLHVKGLFNNRTSFNQAAPEPIFVGPYAGTGGIADTISISAANPYNPYGIDLTAGDNFGWITKRPLEVGPRVFEQNVDTWYFNAGLTGTLHIGNGYTWDLNFVDSENTASQTFKNGYNVAKMKIALGDPAICAAVPGCVPLDLFGGQARPMTAAMINYIRSLQVDSSKQALQLVTANISGDLFHIGDRVAGFALGAEHRLYKGSFNPDPLRQSGESQDSFAAPVAASYTVTEEYAELNLPLLSSLSASAALRFSDYSTFGNETTGKVGFRWQPIKAIALRGTYSKGFRAPNIGELYGLTQFGATLVDPCGPTGTLVVNNADGLNTTPLETACRAQGVGNGFEQANTQITTFTGGNAKLKPEKSDSYTVGLVHQATWAEGRAGTDRLDFELTYYHHSIKGAIQARDLQALLNACLKAGGLDAKLCSPFSRPAGSGGNLAPPTNFLDNLGEVSTSGVDAKINWTGKPNAWGHFTAALQGTVVSNYKAVDSDGNVAQRQVGIEVDNSAIPKLQANLQLGWARSDWEANWGIRFIDAVTESCSNATVTPVPGCPTNDDTHKLSSVVYNDVQAAWSEAFKVKGLKLSLGVNNVFGVNPPVCYSCTLNGYDAGTYDLPGAFWNLSAKYDL
jgi:iron complex outermembrane receptor protein